MFMTDKEESDAARLLALVPQNDMTTVKPIPSESVEQLLVNPGRVHRHGDPMDIVHLAESVMKADQFVCATTGGKIQLIVDQIRALQEKARDILVDAKRDADLHHIACNFTKIPGHTYHLYQRESESLYFSMLSPEDWGSSCPHKHVGSYRLEHDHSWTPLEDIENRSKDIDAINKVIDTHGLPPNTIQYKIIIN